MLFSKGDKIERVSSGQRGVVMYAKTERIMWNGTNNSKTVLLRVRWQDGTKSIEDTSARRSSKFRNVTAQERFSLK